MRKIIPSKNSQLNKNILKYDLLVYNIFIN